MNKLDVVIRCSVHCGHLFPSIVFKKKDLKTATGRLYPLIIILSIYKKNMSLKAIFL